MEFEESIYNLIPKEAYVPPKPARHVSKHNPGTAPTASTFCLGTSSKPGVSNLSGETVAPTSAHITKGASNTFGLPKGAAKPDAATFRLKGTGTFVLPEGKYLDLKCARSLSSVQMFIVTVIQTKRHNKFAHWSKKLFANSDCS